MKNVGFMIQAGLAYVVDSSMGNFVIFDYEGFRKTYPVMGMKYSTLNPPPVHYPIIADCMRNKKDCVLWAPYVNGTDSPWGRGLVSVNTEYIMNYVF